MATIKIEEVWKDIQSYEGYYQISNHGRVKSFHINKKGKLLKIALANTGYESVGLYKNRIQRKASPHRLVAEHFIPNPHNYPEVNHIDEKKTNNHVNNLEWCSKEYNLNHGTRNRRIAKAQSKAVSAKCIATGKIMFFESISEARRSGFNASSIWKVCNGKMNKHRNHIWKYI